MRLLNRIALNVSVIVFLVMSVWAVFFYVAVMREVNDEVDDALEGFSELVITRTLAGMEMPRHSNGTNNEYYIREVNQEYIVKNIHNRYQDSLIYIREKRETEPARVLKTFFKDKAGKDFELVVISPTIEKEDLQQAILEWILVLWIGLIIVVVGLNIGVFRRIMNPLYTLLKWLDHYQIGGKNKPLQNTTNILEFKKLNEAAMRNANRSEEIFNQQKQFIGNASHEIQTPLAICRNRLELLIENESLNENQIGEIGKVIDTLSGITRLNKSLLLLSKIENGEFKDVTLININDLVRSRLSDLQDIYGYLDIQVDFQINGVFQLTMSEALASVLVTNLLKNAFVHNRENGKIFIELNTMGMQVLNTGQPEALDQQRLFERFQHGRKKEGANGLGLAILDSICKLYELHCFYKFHDRMHGFFVEIPDLKKINSSVR
ncbi:MAG: sensor histidine kinase [Bacteroidales bacterium]